jgi:hypothetical protein
MLSNILIRTTAPLLDPPEVPQPNVIPTVTRLESALPNNTRVTPLQSALPNSLDLKSFRIRTCKKAGGRGSSVNQLCRHSALAVCRTSSVCTSLQPRPGPPQVAAPITECHNPSFDCTSRLRTPVCPEFWRRATSHESPVHPERRRRVTVFSGGS